jgi:site-specific DNA recombinase
VKANNQMIPSKDAIIRQYKTIIKTLTDTSALEQERAKQQSEHDVVEGLIRRLIAKNAQVGLAPEDYTQREAEVIAQNDAAKAAMTDIEAQIQKHKNCCTKLAAFIRTLEKQDGLMTTFDEKLWNATVESVTVYSKELMVFVFKWSDPI